MPDYAAQWNNVWNPYRTYAAHNNDRGAITIIDHVNEIKEKRLGKEESLQESLRELNNVFFTELGNYTTKCQQLKNAYTDNLRDEVQDLNYKLRQSGPMAFMPESGVALRLCANVTKEIYKGKQANLIQGNAHQELVYKIVREIGRISVGLKADRDLYGANVVAETLRKIRENP